MQPGRLAALVLAMLLGAWLPAHAQGQPAAPPQQIPTADQYLVAFGTQLSSGCQHTRGVAAAKAEQEGKPDVAALLRNSDIMMCSCVPQHIAGLRAHLSPAQRNEKLSLEQFQARYIAQLIGPCGSRLLKDSWGKDCAVIYGAKHPDNTPAYCACMSQYVSGLPEDQLVALGLENADYGPQAAAAQQRHEPPPAPPPHLKLLLQQEKECGTAQ